MGKIYLPYAEQFDLMNKHLGDIAAAIGRDMDVSTWAGVQKAVRAGVAPSLFPVGTRLKATHVGFGEILYDVVAHDHYKAAHDENAHTMTLMSHGVVLGNMSFDNKEAFYYVDDYLNPGTYHFTIPNTLGSWEAGTYQFTLATRLSAGSQLVINDSPSESISYVYFYANATATLATTQAMVTKGSGGTNLGTLGVELNHVERAAYGSGNYKDSSIRQFLNSAADLNKWWTAKTKFDRIGDNVGNVTGFLAGMDRQLLEVIGEVEVPCVANPAWESPDSSVGAGEKYTVKDKVFLASRAEVFGEDTRDDGSSQLMYYKGATDADRVKYLDGSAVNWFLRSTGLATAGCVDVVGAEITAKAYETAGIVPVFNIV